MAYSQNTQKAALFTVGDDTDAPINVILDLDLADLVGRVVDQGNQAVFKAVVEAEVATPDGNRFRSDLIVADTHGYFDSRLIPTGDGLSLRVRVRPPGDEAPGVWSNPVQLANGLYQIEVPTIVVPEETGKNIAANQKLDGIPGCYPEILRTAKPRERLAGFIQDPEGNPVAGVHLELLYDVPSGMLSSSVAVSGKDGSWNCLVPAGLGSVSVRTHHANYVASIMNRAKPFPKPMYTRADGIQAMESIASTLGPTWTRTDDSYSNTFPWREAFGSPSAYGGTRRGAVTEDIWE
jgi:hypothetical protein